MSINAILSYSNHYVQSLRDIMGLLMSSFCIRNKDCKTLKNAQFENSFLNRIFCHSLSNNVGILKI